MPTSRKNPHATDREEDFRNYGERDVQEGWPYSDADIAEEKGNAPYGGPAGNFDRSDDPGLELSTDPIIESDGGPEFDPEASIDAVEEDGIEEMIFDILQADGRLDASAITVRVRNGVAELAGKVETETARSLAHSITLSIGGVTDTIDNLTTTGADSHIPADADE